MVNDLPGLISLSSHIRNAFVGATATGESRTKMGTSIALPLLRCSGLYGPVILNLMNKLTPFGLVLPFMLIACGCNSSETARTSGQKATERTSQTVSQEPIPHGEKPVVAAANQLPEGERNKDFKPKQNEETAPPAPMRKEEEEPTPAIRGEEKEVPPEEPPPIPEGLKALNSQKSLFFEKAADGTRRVHILAEVCLREGPLEVFLCKRNTKEHESILQADLDARDVHFALIAAGGKPGSTVRFQPEYKPATGSAIKVTMTYYKDGKLLTKPAQYWIRDVGNKKDMAHDWVFAGSRFFKDPENPQKPPYYCANNGEVICISNFADSMMDLPVKSSKEQAELGFVANTERIPPLKTKVLLKLEVVAPEKK